MKGHHHESLQTLAVAVLALPVYDQYGPLAAAGFLTGGLAGTYWLSPDLDLAGKGSSRAAENWGPLKVLWYPYGALFRHRHLSHSWILGPLSRLAYLALLVSPLASYWVPLIRSHPTPFLAALGGYFLSQWIHSAGDGIWFGIRRKVRRRRRRA